MVETLIRPREPAIIQTAATQTAETKPRLTADQIFLKPGIAHLSELGSNLQAVIMFQGILNDPESGISDGRRVEIEVNVKNLGTKTKECGVDISTIRPEDLKSQFDTVIATQTEGIDNEGSFQGVPQAPQS